MWFMLVAATVGVLAGLLRGGSIRRIGTAGFRVWSLLGAGVLLQLASAFVGGTAGTALLVTSYVALVGFGAANARVVGMAVVAVGMAANALVIAANGGMPVTGDAIVAAGIVDGDALDGIDFGTKRHLATDDDSILFLADIIPVRPTREVLSFGDLIIAIGLADVLFHLMRQRPTRVPDAVLALARRGPARQEG